MGPPAFLRDDARPAKDWTKQERVTMKALRTAGVVTLVLLATLALGIGPAPARTPAKKPNAIVIFGDDVGWGDLGTYSGGMIEFHRIWIDQTENRPVE